MSKPRVHLSYLAFLLNLWPVFFPSLTTCHPTGSIVSQPISLSHDLPALNVSDPSVNSSTSAAADSQTFKISNSDLTLAVERTGLRVLPEELESLLLAVNVSINQNVEDYGRDAYLPYQSFEMNRGGLTLVIQENSALKWADLQTIVTGLWLFLYQGRRFRETFFDVREHGYPIAIAHGAIKMLLSSADLTSRRATRSLEISTNFNSSQLLSISNPNITSFSTQSLVEPPSTSSVLNLLNASFANIIASTYTASSLPAQLNSSNPILPEELAGYHVPDSDMTIKFSKTKAVLQPQAARDVLLVAIERVSAEIEKHGEKGKIPSGVWWVTKSLTLAYLNVISSDWRIGVTWLQVANIILGLVGFVIDGENFRTYNFVVQDGIPQREIAFGTFGMPQNS